MNATLLWGGVLIVAALAALALQFVHWRSGRITAAHAVTGMIARGGFLVLGIIYVTGLVGRYPRAPLYGLFMVGAGIFLHLLTGIVQRHRRAAGRIETDAADADASEPGARP